MTWARITDVETHLGIAQDARMVDALDASLAFCHRARWDLPADGPVHADVRHAVVLYASLLYRERTTPQGFATYEELDADLGTGNAMTNVYRLLGTRRPLAI